MANVAKGSDKNRFVGDILEEKRACTLQWVKRRVKEYLMGQSCEADEPYTLLGDRKSLVEALFGTKDPFTLPILSRHDKTWSSTDDKVNATLKVLRASAISGGVTNFSLHVWATSSSTFEEGSCDNESLNKLCPGVFVKLGLPYARWRSHEKCSVSRLDREFRALQSLNSICPGVTSRPLLCGMEDVVNDGSKYLVTEFFSQKHEKMLVQFQNGHVDPRTTRALGYTLAKFHIRAPALLGGRDGILDVEARDYLIKAHYKLVEKEMESYLDIEQLFENLSKFRKPQTYSPDPSICRKHSAFLKANPELFRAVTRHRENFLNPPPETATYAHLDTHTLNILAPEHPDESPYAYCFDDEAYDPGIENRMKLLDMEFSNWGPAGADLGLFMGSAVLYAFFHSCSESLVSSDDSIHNIRDFWRSYSVTYRRYANEAGVSHHNIEKALYLIIHEAFGWGGLWIFRFATPSVFIPITISKHLYQLKESLHNYFVSRKCNETGENGLEMLRSAVNLFSSKSLLWGFGDKQHGITSSFLDTAENLSPDEAMEDFVRELVHSRDEFRSHFATAVQSHTEEVQSES